ncbi:DNA-binding protein [Actinotalea ferrariae CF5-4]|uniref:DNA-binding protein n=1 Tax=Actinotalea ferrariae CF5-4 TaxID=948458 RepID=A0A021VSB8_9CELL|nr:helix-turn-helix domain-containing protein [Actinotalea ferrariae]EYR61957.1 DNA-binding protein [Actinotalea ferrariae CF5-4]
MPPRFLTLADVQEVLNISAAQAYSLVRSGELPALQVGGRGVWRVEATELEGYIQRMYEQTRARITTGDLEAAHDAAGGAPR